MNRYARNGRSSTSNLSTTISAMASNNVSVPHRTDMIRNHAGGYVFEMTPQDQFHQFLVLGTHGSYYQSVAEVTTERLTVVMGFLDVRPFEALAIIRKVEEDRNGKADLILLALAYLNFHREENVRSAVAGQVSKSVRTGYHAEMYLKFLNEFRTLYESRGAKAGWGRSKTRGLRDWAEGLGTRELTLQGLKYREREGYKIQDVFNFAHPAFKGWGDEARKRSVIAAWIMGNLNPKVIANLNEFMAKDDPEIKQIAAWAALHNEQMQPEQAAYLIRENNLPREAVPTEYLKHPVVWKSLLPMPPHATIRNLSNLYKHGLVDDPEAWKMIFDTLGVENLVRARVVPMDLVKAWAMNSNHEIRRLLSARFFDLLKAGGPMKNFHAVIAVDVSGSMYTSVAGLPMTCSTLAQSLAMAYAKSFRSAEIIGFHDRVVNPKLERYTHLGDKMFSEEGGGTNPGSVTQYLLTRTNMPAPDVIIFLTDNELWHGSHVDLDIDRLRVKHGRPILNVSNPMALNSFTMGAPDNPLSLVMAGFDASSIEAVHNKLDLIYTR